MAFTKKDQRIRRARDLADAAWSRVPELDTFKGAPLRVWWDLWRARFASWRYRALTTSPAQVIARWWVQRHPLTVPQAERIIGLTVGIGKQRQPGPMIPKLIGRTEVWHYLYAVAGETLNQDWRQKSIARHPR